MKLSLKSLCLLLLFLSTLFFSCKSELDEKRIITITYNSNDGTDSPQTFTQSFKEGESIQLISISELGFDKEDCTFLGWSNIADSAEIIYQNLDYYTGIDDITLYAIWKTIPVYTITFNANNGLDIPETYIQTFKESDSVQLTSFSEMGFYKDNCEFVGWTTSIESAEIIYQDEDYYTTYADITLYAVWKSVVFVITFDANDGSDNPPIYTKSYTPGEQILISIEEMGFSRNDYNFVGWDYERDSEGYMYVDSDIIYINEDITLYAIWSESPFYSVIFNSNGGSRVNSQSIMSGKTVAKPDAPSKNNYEFIGWYLNDIEYDFNTPVEGNMSLTAKWKIITYNVTFNSDGGSYVEAQTVASGQSVTKPTNPVKEGYEFIGWYLNDDIYNFSSTIKSNIILRAKWAYIYSISYNNSQYCNITLGKKSGIQDTKISFEVTPKKGYEIDTISIVDVNGTEISYSLANEYLYDGVICSVYVFNLPDSNVQLSVIMKEFIYEFHDTVTILPEGTSGTGGTSGTYVYFGDWPKTIKADDVTINVSQSNSIKKGGFTYYKGSDGYWYQQINATACPVNKIYGDDYSPTYSNAKFVSKGGALDWFKVEPIKWRVLTSSSDHKLLLAEDILTGNISFSYDSEEITKDQKTIYPNNYEYSNIRAYLNSVESPLGKNYSNGGFLKTAFSASAQEIIMETNIDNSIYSIYTTEELLKNDPNRQYENRDFLCKSTTDKIFLLSWLESRTFSVTNGGQSTDYAKANYVLMYYWMMRSPTLLYKYPGNAYTNLYHVCVSHGQSQYFEPQDKCLGVRPALWVE